VVCNAGKFARDNRVSSHALGKKWMNTKNQPLMVFIMVLHPVISRMNSHAENQAASRQRMSSVSVSWGNRWTSETTVAAKAGHYWCNKKRYQIEI